jgi:hypothetical protein
MQHKFLTESAKITSDASGSCIYCSLDNLICGSRFLVPNPAASGPCGPLRRRTQALHMVLLLKIKRDYCNV